MHTIGPYGAHIPALGFGTFRLSPEEVLQMIPVALEVGYRHFDTAQLYRNEEAVGEALQASRLPRSKYFLTTKVWPDEFHAGALQRSVEESVRKLKTVPDLLLLHWPNPNVPLGETIRALNAVQSAGMTRYIGISNFPSRLVHEAALLTEVPLITNQVEYHPHLAQTAVIKALRLHDMVLTAYSPLAQGRLAGDPTLVAIGQRYGKTDAQVALRWLVQQPHVAAIPRTKTPARVRENFEVFDFALTDDEMKAIHALARPDGRVVNPKAYFAPEWD